MIDISILAPTELSKIMDDEKTIALSGVVVTLSEFVEVEEWAETLEGVDVYFMEFDKEHKWVTVPEDIHRLQLEMKYATRN